MRYELIIYWSKADNAFLVEVPELPGCMADGGSYEEAVCHFNAGFSELKIQTRQKQKRR